MTLREYIKSNRIYLDGATGTLLQAAGLPAGMPTEAWNLTHKKVLVDIHRSYFDSGSNIVATNTFGINTFKYSEAEITKNVTAAVENANLAKSMSIGTQEKFIALDIGPSGRLLAPLGDCDFEDAVKSFSTVIKAGVKAGADLIFIETVNDCYETKAALLAAKENCDLPVFVSNAYTEDGRLMSGADVSVMVEMLEGMGADAIGINCSLGPKAMIPIVEKYLKIASVPVICKPNAGLPRVENNNTVYDVSSSEFAKQMLYFAKKGVRIMGGCCGTTPEYIKSLVDITQNTPIKKITKKSRTAVTSGMRTVCFDDSPVLIGERINPTGKKRLKQALAEHNIDYILNEGIKQQELGADILDVNAGTPEIDEEYMLTKLSTELQAVCDLPLQLDSSNVSALEKAIRRYNGKPLINSVNGKKESMSEVFPLVKKYGGVVVALTLDENGIPKTAEGRLKIAENILKTAKSYGIDKKNIIFDPLTMTVSAEQDAASVTLQALRSIRSKLKCHTMLGVSNVSFGLPNRSGINAVFFTLALENGLSAAIMNPYSQEMMNVYYSYRALCQKDQNCLDYIKFCENSSFEVSSVTANISADTVKDAIIKGLKDVAASKTKEALKTRAAMDLVQNEIIPALNSVGTDFENKKVFLPQLLMSAEAAGIAFEEIKASASGLASEQKNGCKVVLATVKGDIHDIGKNIVKLLLENYGFSVVDLGRDVSPELILKTVCDLKAPLTGLSALMTTTVPAMEETIELLHKKAKFCKVVVGGAVLTEEYAKQIGADHYSKDAMDTVRYAQTLIKI